MDFAQLSEALSTLQKLCSELGDTQLGNNLRRHVGWIIDNQDEIIRQTSFREGFKPLLKMENIPDDVEVLVARGLIATRLLESTLNYIGYRSLEDAEADRDPIEFRGNKIHPPIPPLLYQQLQSIYDLPLQQAIWNREIDVYVPVSVYGDYERLEPGRLYPIIQVVKEERDRHRSIKF